MLMYSNKKGTPDDINVYYDPTNAENQWLLGTVWSTKCFPTLDALLDSMVRNGIETKESIKTIKTKIEKRMNGESAAMPDIDEDSLTWTTVGTSQDTLSRLLTDVKILHVEPLSYPLTDGLTFCITDRTGKNRLLQIEVTEELMFNPEQFNGIPLTVMLSSPIPTIDE